MPLMVTKPANKPGHINLLIVLGPDNLERMEKKDPFEIHYSKHFRGVPLDHIAIVYATDAEMTQYSQLLRQGRSEKVLELATQGWEYRPDLGDHDMGPERF